MEIKEKIEALEQQMTALQSQIAKLKKAEKVEGIKHWDPEHDELFYYVTDEGAVDRDRYQEEYFKDQILYLNAFKTREEAELWAERFKVFRELSLFALVGMPTIDENKYVYMIEYDREDDDWYINPCRHILESPMAFESEELALKAANYVGEDRLKKYWFGVGGR